MKLSTSATMTEIGRKAEVNKKGLSASSGT